MRRAGRLAAVGLALALAARAAGPEEPPIPKQAEAVRAEGTRLYRKRQYAAACRKFEAAAKLAPDGAAVLADLGLCLQKAGKPPAAIEANTRAARLAKSWAVRKGAYFNLAQLGAALPLPAEGRCADLAAPAGCARAVRACAFHWRCAGNRLGSGGTAVVVGVKGWADLDEAKAVASRSCNSDDTMPVAPNDYGAAERRAEVEAGEAQPADVHALTVTERIDDEPDRVELDCTLVLADGCSGRVAVVCKVQEEGGKPRTLVDEFLLAIPDEPPAGE